MASEISGLTLLVPTKADPERDAVATEWEHSDGYVVRLDKFWQPPALDAENVRIYGPDTFGLVLGDILGLTLLEPAQDLPAKVPEKYVQRETWVESLGKVQNRTFPLFVKPLVPKQFSGRVYPTVDELEREVSGLEAAELVFASVPVTLEAEARVFVLRGQALDAATYEGSAECSLVNGLAEQFASDVVVPKAVVLDFGLMNNGQWVFIEANAAWGAGLNGCAASKVLPAIAHATAHAT